PLEPSTPKQKPAPPERERETRPAPKPGPRSPLKPFIKIVSDIERHALDTNTGELLGIGTFHPELGGELRIAIYTEEDASPIRGGAVFNGIYESFVETGQTINTVRGIWGRTSDNLTSFNAALLRNLSEEAAAFETFTGKMAHRKGHKSAAVDAQTSVKNQDGTYSKAEDVFR